ncbi:MAG: tetratricopeptide repeat protein, partial [Clostridiales Family XIII bacterium]|nr:tetratricopeptide repeat protein [Clostridiales Family XIII bacterium]
VTGAGGFGKTQAAVEYAYAHASEYELMWLFNAESEATLEADCREFAIENLGVRETTGIDFPAIMRMFSDWVKENPSCLLIYDNAEGCPRLREYLPTSLGRSHILINSREKLRGIVAEPLEADVFSPPDSVEFIRRRVGNADPADAEALAEALGRLPLALECAAAYIEENKYNISEYLKLYERHGLKVLSGHPAATSYDKTVLTVWSATFEKISQEAESDEETKAALQLFNLCAYCAADDIPLRLFIDGRDGAPALLKEFLDPKDAPGHDALIGKLTRYSLVSLNRVGERARLTVHRLIQTAVKQGFGRNAEWVSRCLKIACSGFKYRYGTREELEEFSASLPHVAEIARQAEGVLTDDDSQGKIACVYEEAEEGLYHRGDYVGALELCRKVLAIREKTSGAEHLDTAGAYNNIALMYRAQGDYKNALELYSKALEIYEKTLGAEHPRTAVAYNNIANVYHAQGGYENALEWHRKALAIREKTLGAEHLDTADTYNNIAGVYRAQGEYENALELCHKALAIREEKLGAEHLDTADTYNNIASVYHDQGKYENALEHYRKVLKVIEKTLGAEYPHTAGGYNNIALVYRDQGKYENALELLCKALAIREKTLGAEHLDTADTYNNIAIVYRDQEKYENALEYYSKALAIIEKTLGEEHPRTAVAYNNIANVYHAQGGYENALEWHRKALAIREKKLGAEHPNTAVTYYNIATVYHAQGRYREALDLFSLAMNIFMIKGLEEHPYAKEWFSAMRACYEEAGGDEKDFDSWWEERLKTYPTWCA